MTRFDAPSWGVTRRLFEGGERGWTDRKLLLHVAGSCGDTPDMAFSLGVGERNLECGRREEPVLGGEQGKSDAGAPSIPPPQTPCGGGVVLQRQNLGHGSEAALKLE